MTLQRSYAHKGNGFETTRGYRPVWNEKQWPAQKRLADRQTGREAVQPKDRNICYALGAKLGVAVGEANSASAEHKRSVCCRNLCLIRSPIVGIIGVIWTLPLSGE